VRPFLETGEKVIIVSERVADKKKKNKNTQLDHQDNQKQLSSQVSFLDLLNDSFNFLYDL